MDRNELKKLNRVELEEKYQDVIKELKVLKGKLFLLKSLEVSNTTIGVCSIAESIRLMYNNNISKEAILIMAFGMLNIVTADRNYNILDTLKEKIDTENSDKDAFEKEFKVRNFIKKRNGLYQI